MDQNYAQYTDESHQVWEILYGKQMSVLNTSATDQFLSGLKKIKFQSDRIPDFKVINGLLDKLTGWQVYAVPGIIDNKPFFELLAQKKFPATTWMRKMSQLQYIEEPDMFHDVFGHVPLLSEPHFAEFLNGLSEIGLKYIHSSTAIELMARIYWYTVEFGLIRENEETKIYGAGILSSNGESIYCLSDKAKRVWLDVNKILETPYIKDKYQSIYFVAKSYKQLYELLPMIDKRIEMLVNSGLEIGDGQAFSFEALKLSKNG